MNLSLIVKGFIVGIGKVIPGVSGSMLAIALGIYETLIEAVTNFFSNPKKHFCLLANFCIGLFLAIVVFSKIITFFLHHFYYQTIFLFLGLILGTLMAFKKKVKLSRKNRLLFLFILFLMLFLSQLPSTNQYIFQNTGWDYIYIIILGGIDAITSIVPGLSGTAIYMLLGSYEYILSILGNPFSLAFILYGIGLLIAAIITCFIMRYLLKYKKEETYSILFAFMTGSMIILLFSVFENITIFLGVLLIVGVLLGYIFTEK